MHVLSRVVGLHTLFIFFFQAEDGIRDLVRSRGLGDVYKRQVGKTPKLRFAIPKRSTCREALGAPDGAIFRRLQTVSYTHLTLPTSDLV